MNDKLCSAIDSKKVIRFLYDGGQRLAEPFCHGKGKQGQDFLRAYQVGGYSESGNSVGWKLFRVDQIRDITITLDSFSGVRPQYNPQDSAMREIYCAV